MRLIDSFEVRSKSGAHRIELVAGDLVTMHGADAADILVVSAFPGDYVPTARSVIGALHRSGVSVARLAEDKEVDLRDYSSCWLSRPIANQAIPFRRILCFEPPRRGSAPETVGDVFRSLIPFVSGKQPVSRVAMPILASGAQGESSVEMLGALVDASVHWLATGLAVQSIAIVMRDGANEAALAQRFAEVKRAHAPSTASSKPPRYDAFVSYSQKNAAVADMLVEAMRQHRAEIRIFMDRLELTTGAAWQQQIYEALEDSASVVCLLSPEYVQSKMCQEEFNMALIRQREADRILLRPVYIHSAHLPVYMKAHQWIDAREGNPERVREAAPRVLT